MSELKLDPGICLIQKFAGMYRLGGSLGLCISLINKPIFIHRFFMKLLLGWEWIDVDT